MARVVKGWISRWNTKLSGCSLYPSRYDLYTSVSYAMISMDFHEVSRCSLKNNFAIRFIHFSGICSSTTSLQYRKDISSLSGTTDLLSQSSASMGKLYYSEMERNRCSWYEYEDMISARSSSKMRWGHIPESGTMTSSSTLFNIIPGAGTSVSYGYDWWYSSWLGYLCRYWHSSCCDWWWIYST